MTLRCQFLVGQYPDGLLVQSFGPLACVTVVPFSCFTVITIDIVAPVYFTSLFRGLNLYCI